MFITACKAVTYRVILTQLVNFLGYVASWSSWSSPCKVVQRCHVILEPRWHSLHCIGSFTISVSILAGWWSKP